MNAQKMTELTGRQVKSVQEWANVYFVCFYSGRPTFVSKKAAKPEILHAEWTQGERKAKLHKVDGGYRLVIDGPQGRVINTYPVDKVQGFTKEALLAAGSINIVIKYAA